jgi:ankyrin repeat protein
MVKKSSFYKTPTLIRILIGLDKAGNTPLHWACRGGHLEAVQLLLSKIPAVNAANKIGDTPLHCAAWAGNLPVTQLLAQCQGIQINLKNKNG